MNIFVTGGAGYIGGATTANLLAAGHAATVYDNLSRGHRAAVPAGARFILGDIGDQPALAHALSTDAFDAVMHFAAVIEAGESMERPGLYFRNNVAYAHNVIEAAVAAGCQRFVLSSTAAVYAGSDEPLTEDSRIAPANVYGETKRMIEMILRWYQRLSGLRYASLRYFNAAGALPERGEAHQPETHLIPRVLQVALGQQEHVGIFGTDYPTSDGTCIRDYIHIADLATAHLLALEALDHHRALVYNLGTGHGYSVREVLDTARRVTGHPIPAIESPRRPGDAPWLVADPAKIKRELNWELRHSDLPNIIATAWEWHYSHPGGYNQS